MMSAETVVPFEVHTAPAPAVLVTADAMAAVTAWSTTSPAEFASLFSPRFTESMLRRLMSSSVTSESLPHFLTLATAGVPAPVVVREYSAPGATTSGAASAKMVSPAVS